MKVRIQGNSIRLRLKQPEVEKFGRDGTVEEALNFGDEQKDGLRFILKMTSAENFIIQYECGTTIIGVPKKIAEDWVHTEQVGFDEKIKTGHQKFISILVEKDFKCLDGKEEDEAGSYPNPLKSC